MKKNQYLNFFIAGTLSMVLGGQAYAQNKPGPGECIAKSYISGNTFRANHTFKQDPITVSRPGFSDSNTFNVECKAGATITIYGDPLESYQQPWLSYVNSVGPGRWWPIDRSPYLSIVIAFNSMRSPSQIAPALRILDLYERGKGRDHLLGTSNYVVPRDGEYTVKIVTSGKFSYSGMLYPNFGGTKHVMTLGNKPLRVEYTLHHRTIDDPCSGIWDVTVGPNRISLGSQTTQNFSNRIAHFKVEAHKRYNPGCAILASEPRVSFHPDGTNNVGNIMYLDNGSEIVLEDISGREVTFGVEAPMGKKIGGGSEWYLDQKVGRDYKLTWRKTPGKTLRANEFTKNLRIQMVFP